MSYLTAVKAKIVAQLAALGEDILLPGFGDEGPGPVFNTVVIDGSTLLQGQAWSGPPADLSNPQDGPDPAFINKSAMSQLTIAMSKVLIPAIGQIVGSVATSSSNVRLNFDQTIADSTLYGVSNSEFTVLHKALYRGAISISGSGATDDTVVKVQILVNGTQIAGSSCLITIPTSASPTITEGSCYVHFPIRSLEVNDIVKVFVQRQIGSVFNITESIFSLRMVAET